MVINYCYFSTHGKVNTIVALLNKGSHLLTIIIELNIKLDHNTIYQLTAFPICNSFGRLFSKSKFGKMIGCISATKIKNHHPKIKDKRTILSHPILNQ